MPISTNKEGMKKVEFGTGDILLHHVCTGTKSSNGLSFKQHEPRVIGERTEEYAGLEMEKHNPEVHFTFNSIDSVDVLIEMLHEVRDCMVSEKIDREEAQ